VVPFEICEGARPSHSEETDDEGGSGGLNEVVEVFLEGGGIFICVESLSLWMAGDNDDTDGRCGDEVRMIE